MQFSIVKVLTLEDACDLFEHNHRRLFTSTNFFVTFLMYLNLGRAFIHLCYALQALAGARCHGEWVFDSWLPGGSEYVGCKEAGLGGDDACLRRDMALFSRLVCSGYMT